MLTAISRFLAAHRIGISRCVALALFLLLLAMQSRQEGKMLAAYLFFAGLALVGIATIGRLWCALYISGYKDRELVTVGPYSMTRNPLYFFSLAGFAGVGMATETITIAVALVVLFAVVYPYAIRREERFLRTKFGEAFSDYCKRTPRFFPNPRLLREPDSYAVDPRRFRRALVDVLGFVWLVALIELVEAFHDYHVFSPLFRLP